MSLAVDLEVGNVTNPFGGGPVCCEVASENIVRHGQIMGGVRGSDPAFFTFGAQPFTPNMPTNGSPGNANTLPDQIVPDSVTTVGSTARLESVINQPVQVDVRTFSSFQLLVPPIGNHYGLRPKRGTSSQRAIPNGNPS